MQRRDALAKNRVAVLGRRVADVLREAPAGMLAVGVAHVAIARDLRDDRRRSDRGARRVAVDDRAVRPLLFRRARLRARADAPAARGRTAARSPPTAFAPTAFAPTASLSPVASASADRRCAPPVAGSGAASPAAAALEDADAVGWPVG